MKKTLIATAMAVVLGTLAVSAHAQDTSTSTNSQTPDNSYGLNDIFSNGHVDGELRMYDFSRLYNTKSTPDAHAFAAAALINANTGTFFGGFSLGGSFVTANSLGLDSLTPAKVDTTLMGAKHSLGAISQAYVQYKNDWFMFKGGYQYLNTPWMGNSDGRAVPASYNALTFDFTPITGWDIYAIREFNWRSRTSQDYVNDNLYYPNGWNTDTLYGGNGSLPAKAPSSHGTYVGGTTYVNGGLKAQAWYYDFKGFAEMAYADGSYILNTGTFFNPVVGAQVVNETTGSNNILVDTDTKILGVAGQRVRSQAWGADVGVVIPNGRFDLFYNKLDQENGAVGGGALISPFTASYATDPLYTTSMIRGLVETGPGHAWKGKFTYNLFNKEVQLVASYAKYTTYLRGDSHDVYFDVIWNMDRFLKGLQIRDRWERSTGGIGALNPGNEPFTYNRVMLSYKF